MHNEAFCQKVDSFDWISCFVLCELSPKCSGLARYKVTFFTLSPPDTHHFIVLNGDLRTVTSHVEMAAFDSEYKLNEIWF